MFRNAVFCLLLFYAYIQTHDASQCTLRIDVSNLKDAIDIGSSNRVIPSTWPLNTSEGFDHLFQMLRSTSLSSLVILLDISEDVRPNHFFLVNKPMIEALLNYHVAYKYNYVSLVAFDGVGFETVCRNVRSNCNGLAACTKTLTYSRNESEFWINDSILKALREGEGILKSRSTVQSALVIFSGFQISNNDPNKLFAIKGLSQTLSRLGTKVYTIISSFGEERAIARDLATSEKEYMLDSEFLKKLYETTVPATGLSCGASYSSRTSLRNNVVCLRDDNYGNKCICKFGYSGTNCAIAPSYCNDTNACPAKSSCSMANDGRSYNCSCDTCDYWACMNFESQGPDGMTGSVSTSGPTPGPPESPNILIIVVSVIGGLLLICLVIGIVLIIRKRRPDFIYKRSTSQASQRGDEEDYANPNYQREEVDDDIDVEDYMEMSQFVVTQRGMDDWESYTRQLLIEGKLREICIASENMLQFCCSSMKFLPQSHELSNIKDWLAGHAQAKDNITYKGRMYKVVKNENSTIQAISVGRQNPATRLCICNSGEYYIIAIREKTHARGDMTLCHDTVEEIKRALQENQQTHDTGGQAAASLPPPANHSALQPRRYMNSVLNTQHDHATDVTTSDNNNNNANPILPRYLLPQPADASSKPSIANRPPEPLPKPQGQMSNLISEIRNAQNSANIRRINGAAHNEHYEDVATSD